MFSDESVSKTILHHISTSRDSDVIHNRTFKFWTKLRVVAERANVAVWCHEVGASGKDQEAGRGQAEYRPHLRYASHSETSPYELITISLHDIIKLLYSYLRPLNSLLFIIFKKAATEALDFLTIFLNFGPNVAWPGSGTPPITAVSWKEKKVASKGTRTLFCIKEEK